MEKTVELRISNMSCDHCVSTVARALRSVPGVKDVRVSLAEARATVVYDEQLVKPDALTRATEMAGYPSEVVTP